MELIDKDYIVSQLREKEREIKERFHVKHLDLFGSYAKGKQNENSDIDILVEFESGFEEDFSNELNLQVYLYHFFRKNIGLCEKNRLRSEYAPYIINENLISIC